jgi:hypothetical protein
MVGVKPRGGLEHPTDLQTFTTFFAWGKTKKLLFWGKLHFIKRLQGSAFFEKSSSFGPAGGL